LIRGQEEITIKTDNSSFEKVKQFKCLGISLTNQHSVQEEIKSRLKAGNASYRSMQNLLSSCLLCTSIKFKTYGTVILPVVLYECETWSLALRKECRLRFFANRVLRSIFGPKRDEVTREWRKLHNEELNDLYCSANIFQMIKSRRMRGVGHVAHVGVSRGVYLGFDGET
jgi:hypothetical protein